MPTKQKGKGSPASTPIKRRKLSRLGASAAASAGAVPSNTPQQPTKKPTPVDPDMPNVERVLQKAVEEIAQGHSRGRVKASVIDSVSDLLAQSLFIDVSECRRRLLSNAQSTAVANCPAQEASKRDHQVQKKNEEEGVDVQKDGLQSVPKVEKDSDAVSNSTISDDGLEKLQTCPPVVDQETGVPKRKKVLRSPPKRARGPKELKKVRKPKKAISGNKLASIDLLTEARASSGWAGNFRQQVVADVPLPEVNRNREREIAITTDTAEEEVLKAGIGEIEYAVEHDKPASQDLSLSGNANLPWWRPVESRMTQSERRTNETDLLKAFVMTVIRSCVRDSWTSEALREGYERDPASSRGRAFSAIGSSLLMMERARHMGQCRTKWRPELIVDLLDRRVFEWSAAEEDPSFEHFTGCEVCLGHRVATKRLRLSGARYDALNFWPSKTAVNVLSVSESDESSLSVAVELGAESNVEKVVSKNCKNEDGNEFWVDAQCLRKCLVFHELVHSIYILAEHSRGLIEDVVRGGVVNLAKASYNTSGQKRASVAERLEKHIVQELSQNKDFVSQRVEHLVDIVRLGNIYFAAGDAEVLDAGGGVRPQDAIVSSKIYDAPLELNDDKYENRLQWLESLTEKKMTRELFT